MVQPPGGARGARIAPVPRIVHKADFERLLSTRAKCSSAHFALHHASTVAAERSEDAEPTVGDDISTASGGHSTQTVDKVREVTRVAAMIPKRHAKRAVTRNLLKRQIRQAFGRHRSSLVRGLWLVRLRRPFGALDFPSARSVALATAVRAELDDLLLRGLRSRPERHSARPA